MEWRPKVLISVVYFMSDRCALWYRKINISVPLIKGHDLKTCVSSGLALWNLKYVPIPVVARSKKSVTARLVDCGFESPVGMDSVSHECCVYSDRSLCDGPIPHLEESYRAWCVCVWSRNFNNEMAYVQISLLPHNNKGRENYAVCRSVVSTTYLAALGPNILLSTLFSNTFSLLSSLNINDQV
jgi:hypothetical protein